MIKEKVLLIDNRGTFLKMFKKKLKDEFQFYESKFASEEINNSDNFDKSIFVVYNKLELMEYLNLYHNSSQILVCQFNKKLSDSLSFLEEVNNIILIDDCKTKNEIICELNDHLKSNSDLHTEKIELNLVTQILKNQFQNFQETLFSLKSNLRYFPKS